MERLRIEVVENATKTVNIMPETPLDKVVADCMKDYLEMRKAEDEGLLLRPKCRLEDIVYALWSVPTESKYVVYPAEVKEINLSSTNAQKMLMYKLEPIAFRGRYNKYYDDDFGKVVFMSEEEAEQVLEAMKGGAEC